MYFINTKLFCHFHSRLFAVTGQHDAFFDTNLFHSTYGFFCTVFYCIRNHQSSGKFSVTCHIDNGSTALARGVSDTFLFHQFFISDQHCFVVNRDGNTMSGDLICIFCTLHIRSFAVSFPDRICDRMRRVTFSQSRNLQKFCLCHALRLDLCNLKFAFCKCSGLIKYDRCHLSNGFQIVASFYQHTNFGCCSDSAEESHRNRDDQCTWAGDNQKNTCSLDPFCKSAPKNQWRNQCQNHSSDRDNRSIIFCKFCDKVLYFCFLAACILYQLQDLRNRRIIKFFRNFYFQCTASVHTSADDLITGLCTSRNRLAGQCCGINKRFSFDHHAVQRDTLARFDYDDIANLHVIRIDLCQHAVLLNVGIFRTDIHHRGDGLSGFADRIALEQFTDLIEQHNGYCF